MNQYPEKQVSSTCAMNLEQLRECGYVYWREIGDTLYAIAPMTFGKGRLLIDCNNTGYEDFYCFPSVERAIASLDRYTGDDGQEFTDWHRHFSTGRRREDGNPATEFINY